MGRVVDVGMTEGGGGAIVAVCTDQGDVVVWSVTGLSGDGREGVVD